MARAHMGWHVAGSGGTVGNREGVHTRPLGLSTPDPQVPRSFGSQSVPRYEQVEASILVFLHLRPSAHVCFGQQVEPSTGFFGWHVAEGGGKTPPRQEGTQVRPLGLMTPDPQVPRSVGSQSLPRYDLVKVRARGRIGASGLLLGRGRGRGLESGLWL